MRLDQDHGLALRVTVLAGVAAVFLFTMTGCPDEGHAEDFGESIDDVAEDVKDRAEGVIDSAENSIDAADDELPEHH